MASRLVEQLVLLNVVLVSKRLPFPLNVLDVRLRFGLAPPNFRIWLIAARSNRTLRTLFVPALLLRQ